MKLRFEIGQSMVMLPGCTKGSLAGVRSANGRLIEISFLSCKGDEQHG